MKSDVFCALDCQAGLGECPVWSVANGCLYWVDINAPSLNRFDPRAGGNVSMPMPSSIGSFALLEQGGFLLALRDGLWLADEHGVLGAKVAEPPYVASHHRFNDGKCDPQGRFVVGTMNERRDAPDAGLWRLEHGQLVPLRLHITVSNALAWTLDGKSMYHADTPSLSVMRFSYDSAGGLSSPQVFAQWSSESDRPDGAAVDSEGNFWVALYRGGRVVQFSPKGQLLDEFALPASCPTMCAFGGDDLRTLYVTTARWSDDPRVHPQAGSIFAFRTGIPGRAEPLAAKRWLRKPE